MIATKLLLAAAVLCMARTCVSSDPATDKCVKDTGANRVKLAQGLLMKDVSGLDNRDKCFLKCIMLAKDWMTTDGTIKQSALSEMPPRMLPYYETCKDQTEPDFCERGYQFYKCIFEEEKNHH